MKRPFQLIGALAFAGAFVGCGSNTPVSDGGVTDGGKTDSGTTDAGDSGTQYALATIEVDDSLNKVYADGDLEWKGSFKNYDDKTGRAEFDERWRGPFAKLYDDGPSTAGGHEKAGAVKGDNKFGATVLLAVPAAGTQNYEYGLQDSSAFYNNGWVWLASGNGIFTLTAGSTATVNATGQTFPQFGTIDLRIHLDSAKLGAMSDGSARMLAVGTNVQLKSSLWGWAYVDAGTVPSSDSTYTVVFSNIVGTGKAANHSGLLKSGQAVQFVWGFKPPSTLGDAGTETQEYRNAAPPGADAGVVGSPSAVGVTAEWSTDGGTWTTVGVMNQPSGDQNPLVTIP